MGLISSDNDRFARLAWEIPAVRGNDWARLAKGGEYVQSFSDNELLVKWQNGFGEMAAYNLAAGNEAKSRVSSDSYFKPALTYTERTASRFSVRPLPAGSIFSNAGPAILSSDPQLLLPTLGVMTSHLFFALHDLCLGGGDSVSSGNAARHYTSGLLGKMPFPEKSSLTALPTTSISRLVEMGIEEAAGEETCSFYDARQELACSAESLVDCAAQMTAASEQRFLEALECSWQIELATQVAYGCTQEIADDVAKTVGRHPQEYPDIEVDLHEFQRLYGLSEDELVDEVASRLGFPRHIVVKSYVWDRRLELLCHAFQCSPKSAVCARQKSGSIAPSRIQSVAKDVLSYLFGRAIGRWGHNVEIKTSAAELFSIGLPNSPPSLAPTTGDSTDVGILVDDPGHERDVVKAIVAVTGSDTATMILDEITKVLCGANRDLLIWIRSDFFSDHVKRYSMHRRQAPIYWALGTTSGSYTIWLYYHRFRRDTLSLALGDFAKPKLRHEQRQLDDLRTEAGPQPTRSQREEIEAHESLVSELSAFVEELARVAPLWNPDLNDGVIINSAPLWRMIGHTPWRKSVKECWDTLCAGDFDWARLAMHLWPERCVPKCADDRSLAIAHDLDSLLWVEDYGKWRKLLKPADEILDQKQRRQLPVYDRLREALQQLVAAPQGPTSAEKLWQRLESGQFDESSLALILWPRRVVGLCINDQALAKKHCVQVPARLTEKSTEQLLTRYEHAGLPQSVSVVGAVFQRATPWANVWHELEQGVCDHQPAALWLWPDRVIEKCLADRELCAQHELTRFFWYDDRVTCWRRRVAPAQEVTAEVTRRHNPTVKAALDSLLTAPPLTGAGGGRRGSRTATTQRITHATASDAAPDDATPTRSRPRTSVPTTDIETLDMVKNVIAAVPNGASKADVLTATGLSEARWTAAINTLLEQGTITRTGERRGTRYHFASENGQTNSSLATDTDM